MRALVPGATTTVIATNARIHAALLSAEVRPLTT